MADVLRPVELTAERAGDVSVINERTAVTRFPPGQAAEDGRLVRAALDGDAAAFTRLYATYGRVIHGLLLARVGRDEVDDLVQDVFLTAWRRLDDLRDPAAFGGWIVMIARNRATDFRRRAVHFVQPPQHPASPGTASRQAGPNGAPSAHPSLAEPQCAAPMHP